MRAGVEKKKEERCAEGRGRLQCEVTRRDLTETGHLSQVLMGGGASKCRVSLCLMWEKRTKGGGRSKRTPCASAGTSAFSVAEAPVPLQRGRRQHTRQGRWDASVPSGPLTD